MNSDKRFLLIVIFGASMLMLNAHFKKAKGMDFQGKQYPSVISLPAGKGLTQKSVTTASNVLNSSSVQTERKRAQLALELGVQNANLFAKALKIRMKPVYTECLVGDVDIMMMDLQMRRTESIYISLESLTSDVRTTLKINVSDLSKDMSSSLDISAFEKRDLVGMFICGGGNSNGCQSAEPVDHQSVYLDFLKNQRRAESRESIYYYQTMVFNNGRVHIVDPQVLSQNSKDNALAKLSQYLQEIGIKKNVDSKQMDRVYRLNYSVNNLVPIVEGENIFMPLSFNSSRCGFAGSERLQVQL